MYGISRHCELFRKMSLNLLNLFSSIPHMSVQLDYTYVILVAFYELSNRPTVVFVLWNCRRSISIISHAIKKAEDTGYGEVAHSLFSVASPRLDPAVPRAPTPLPVTCSRPSCSSIHPGTWLLA